MSNGIQFEKAEYESGNHCVICQNELQASYFKINNQTTCSSCADKAVSEHRLIQLRGGRLLPALLYGAGAAIAGAAIYAIIAFTTGFEFGLISILIGWMVGKAMMRGSQGVGSRKLQIAALALTYLSITGGYIPGLIQEFTKMPDTEVADDANLTPVAEGESESLSASAQGAEPTAAEPLTLTTVLFALVVTVGIAALVPFFALTTGVSGILGIIILGVGLMQAWKETKEQPFAVSGPFEIAAQEKSSEAHA